LSQLKVFLWAGLLWEDREIKLTDLDTMMDLKRVKYYSEQVDEALKLAFGITDEDIAAAQKAMEEVMRKLHKKMESRLGDLKKGAYGFLKLRPREFWWDYVLAELNEMLAAYSFAEEHFADVIAYGVNYGMSVRSREYVGRLATERQTSHICER